MDKEDWKLKKSRSKQQISKTNTPQMDQKSTISMWAYDQKGKTPPKLKIATWNVNGIRSVLSQRRLVPYLDKNQIDILCINETKIDLEAYNKSPILLHGYSGYWNFCKCSAGYSGVAIFSKFLPLSMKEDLPQANHCKEGRVITLEFEKFYLLAVYSPNSGRYLDRLRYRVYEFDKDFYEYCEELQKLKNVIICGDLNVVREEIDIYKSEGRQIMSPKNPGCTPQERSNFKNFLQKGWIDAFRHLNPKEVKYTWWDNKIMGRKRDIGWRIDYVVVNEEMSKNIVRCDIRCEIEGSDHCPVEIVFSFDQSEKKFEKKETIEDKEDKEEIVEVIQKKKMNQIPFVIRNKDQCTPQ